MNAKEATGIKRNVSCISSVAYMNYVLLHFHHRWHTVYWELQVHKSRTMSGNVSNLSFIDTNTQIRMTEMGPVASGKLAILRISLFMSNQQTSPYSGLKHSKPMSRWDSNILTVRWKSCTIIQVMLFSSICLYHHTMQSLLNANLFTVVPVSN